MITLTAAQINLIKRNIKDWIEPATTSVAQARVRCLAENLGIDVANDSRLFLPDGYLTMPRKKLRFHGRNANA